MDELGFLQRLRETWGPKEKTFDPEWMERLELFLADSVTWTLFITERKVKKGMI